MHLSPSGEKGVLAFIQFHQTVAKLPEQRFLPPGYRADAVAEHGAETQSRSDLDQGQCSQILDDSHGRFPYRLLTSMSLTTRRMKFGA